jgi:hypothetical protein
MTATPEFHPRPKAGADAEEFLREALAGGAVAVIDANKPALGPVGVEGLLPTRLFNKSLIFPEKGLQKHALGRRNAVGDLFVSKIVACPEGCKNMRWVRGSRHG